MVNNAYEIESEYAKNINYSFLSKFLLFISYANFFKIFILFFHCGCFFFV